MRPNVPDRLVLSKDNRGAPVSAGLALIPDRAERRGKAKRKKPGGTAFFMAGRSNRIIQPPCRESR